MKKKTNLVAGLILLFLLIFSCEQEDQNDAFKSTDSVNSSIKSSNDPINILLDREEVQDIDCDETVKRELLAGQHIYVGDILIRKENDALIVTYDLTSTKWFLKESHVFIGDINDAPFTNSGNPKIGHFPHHDSHDLVKEYSYSIQLKDLNNCFSVISHAVVVQIEDENETANETAFGYGDNTFDGNRWGWYLDVCNVDCESTTDTDEEVASSDSPVEGGVDDDTGSNGNDPSGPGNSEIDDNGCMDAYAFDKQHEGNSICFYEDFSSWGWTNYIGINPRHNEPLGITHTYPIFASAFQCDITNSMEIGMIKIYVTGGDGRPFANVSVSLTNPDLMIQEFHFFVGESAYPLDQNGKESINFEDFDISLSGLNISSYSVNDIEWYDASYFISHIKVCPKP